MAWSASACLAALLLVLFVLPTACSAPDDLEDGVIELPSVLSELSGMVAVDERTLACVQDELAAVFLVDLEGKRPVRMLSFGDVGDYEGIAAHGDALWVLRSDGTLEELVRKGDKLVKEQAYKVPFEGEFEGLCVDGDRLLVLPKGALLGKKKEKARRRVLVFQLLLRACLPKALMTLKVDEIEEQIEARQLAGPRRTTAKGNVKVELQLDGTEILVLPDSDLLLLSPKDRLLLRVDRSGEVVATSGLDLDLLPQPEAMALLPDGRLLIGSEGKGGRARIAVVAVPR